MKFAELREATLQLSWSDRWRLWWSLGRSLLGERLAGQRRQSSLRQSKPLGTTQPLGKAHASWPADFAQKTAGQWQGEPLVRDDQGIPENRDLMNG